MHFITNCEHSKKNQKIQICFLYNLNNQTFTYYFIFDIMDWKIQESLWREEEINKMIGRRGKVKKKGVEKEWIRKEGRKRETTDIIRTEYSVKEREWIDL